MMTLVRRIWGCLALFFIFFGESRLQGAEVVPRPAAGEGPGQVRKSQERKGWRDRSLTRAEWERRRQVLKGLSPEERQAKISEWRKERLANRPEIKKLTPEERAVKRQEMRGRLEANLNELRKKEMDGTITPEEKRRLRRLEEICPRFEKSERAGRKGQGGAGDGGEEKREKKDGKGCEGIRGSRTNKAGLLRQDHFLGGE